MKPPTVYILWNDSAGPSVVEAYTVGQAIEFWLASHGMFGYDEVFVAEADGVDSISSVCKLITYSEAKRERLDKHHYATRVLLEGDKIRRVPGLRSETLYAAGYEETPGTFGMFAGPVHNLQEMLDVIPGQYGTKPCIIEFAEHPEAGLVEVVIYRWIKGKWKKVKR